LRKTLIAKKMIIILSTSNSEKDAFNSDKDAIESDNYTQEKDQDTYHGEKDTYNNTKEGNSSHIDCLSFVMCPLLVPLVIGFFSFFFCCGCLQY